MSSYAELSAFGRENGCYLPAESEAIYKPRPWGISPWRWCFRVYRGRLYRVPCPPWPPFPWPGPIQPIIPLGGPTVHGAELVLTVTGVPPEVQGSAVLVSPERGVLALTMAQAAQVEAELQVGPPAGL